MARDARVQILNRLEAELKMPVLVYALGDRPNLITQVAFDQIPLFPRHLDSIGERDAVALLIYTRGGETNAAWPIVNFVRAYAKRVVALVPFFAHSAGTLICLGADLIYMSKLATLSPIDPSVANAFNPQDPTNALNRVPIAVEDVIAYFELAKSQGITRRRDRADAFKRLGESVHPLALGNVHRSIEQINQLADKLIRLHSDASKKEIEERIRRLTTAFYTHSHLINRPEAISLGLPVQAPSAPVEQLLLDYYQELTSDLELLEKFDPSKLIAAGQPAPPTPGAMGAPAQAGPPPTHRFERAFIETASTCDVYVTEGRINMQPQQMPIQFPPGMPGMPGMQQPNLPLVATLEITRDEWEHLA